MQTNGKDTAPPCARTPCGRRACEASQLLCLPTFSHTNQHFLRATEGRLPVGALPARRWAEQVLLQSWILLTRSQRDAQAFVCWLDLLVSWRPAGGGSWSLTTLATFFKVIKDANMFFRKCQFWGARVEFSTGTRGIKRTTSQVGGTLVGFGSNTKWKITLTLIFKSFKVKKMSSLFYWYLNNNPLNCLTFYSHRNKKGMMTGLKFYYKQ